MQLPLSVRLRLSARSVLKVLRRPRYLALGLVGAFLTFQFLMWFYNANLLFYMLFRAPVSLTTKLLFPLQSFGSIFTSFTNLQVISLIALSFVQGIILALLIYIFRQRKIASQGIVAGGGSMLIAVFGFGCTTCGTSLLSPILTLFAAGSAATVGAIVGPIVNFLSVGLGLFALYQLSKPLSTELAKELLTDTPAINNNT